MKISVAGFSLLVFCALLVCASLFLSAPPEPAPASAPQTEFSAERAMAYVRLIAQKPHPAGSAEHARVRDAILNELGNLGLAPEVQTTAVVSRRGFTAATVENIVARLKGTATGPALALVAHYDSVPAAPGAGDDASGCAVLLETLRALRAGPPLRNGVIFVFTDAEEDGLFGASAFVAEHPWAKEISVALNFDSRGVRGPAWMFETSDQNGWLVREFARAAPHPAGSSLMYEVYRRMPNDSDFSIFRRAGIAGMNFGFIDGWSAYHTARDTSEELSAASVQHSGSNALALARRLANLDLATPRDLNLVYFDLPGLGFFHYPAAWAVPIALVAAAIFLALIAVQLRRSRATLRGLLFSLAGMVVSVALTAVAGGVLLRGIRAAHGRWLPEGDFVRSEFYALGLIALGIAIFTAMYALLRRRYTAQSVALGASTAWFFAAVWTAWTVPGVSFVTLWPAVFALLATVAVGASSQENEIQRWAYLLLFPLAVPAVFLFAPLLQGFFLGLGLTDLGTPAIASLLTASLWLLAPQVEMITRRGRALLPTIALLAGIALLAAGAQLTRYDAAHPKPSNILYAWSADSGKALWAAQAAKPDVWTSQFLTSSPQQGTLPEFFPEAAQANFLWSEAPATPLMPPTVQLVESNTGAGARTLRLRIASPRAARWLALRLPEAEVLSATVNGRALAKSADLRTRLAKGWMFGYLNAPAAGVEVLLKIQGTAPVKVLAIDRSPGLPEIAGASFARPETTLPIQSGDQTIVSRSFTF